MEASGVALWACLPKTWRALMYPLPLLTSDVLVAAILGMLATAQLEAVSGSRPMPAASIPIVSEVLAPEGGAKCQCHSSNTKQEEETVELNYTTEEHPHQKQKKGRSAAKALKEPHSEAFSRESAVVKVARQAYFKTHWANFKEKCSHDLSSTFWDMASSTNLLGTKIHGGMVWLVRAQDCHQNCQGLPKGHPLL